MGTNVNVSFGEKHFEDVKVYNPRTEKYETRTLEVVWLDTYKAARDAAIAAIDKYSLSSSDFWISKGADYYGTQCEYRNLILSHSACIKINKQLPDFMRFDPSCVEELHGAEGGVALIYRSKAQGLLKTGEATPRNAGCSYYYATAEKRLFDRVVTANSGLYEEGVYGETESVEFEKDPQTQESAQPSVQQKDDAADTRAMYISDMRSVLPKLQLGELQLCQPYGQSCFEELEREQLYEVFKLLRARLSEAQTKARQPSATVTAPKAGSESGISPVAAMMLNRANGGNSDPSAERPAPPEPAALPIGETVYMCLPGAPSNFQNLSGSTFDQIGIDLLKSLYGRKNAVGRRWVTEDLLAKIEEYIRRAA